MDLSSGSMERIERRSMLEHGPHNGYAASCESDDGLDVAFSFAPLAVVEGSGSRVSRGASAECGLEEHAFQRPVAAKGAAQGAGLSRLAQNGGKACGGGESIWRAETGDVACRGDELGRADDPHTRQAADEGRIRVASDESFQVLIELSEAVPADEGFAGELAYNAGHGGFTWHDGTLGMRRRERSVGQMFEFAQVGGFAQMPDESRTSGGLDLGWCDKAGQQDERRLGSDVEDALEAGMDGRQELAQAGEAAGLVLDEIAPARNEDADSDRRVFIGGDRPQGGPRTHQLGDDAGITRVRFALAAGEAMAGAIDGDPRHMDEGQALGQQHGLQEGRDQALNVKTDCDSVELAQIGSKRVECLLCVVDGAIDQDARVLIDRANPMDVLGDVDSHRDGHVPSVKLVAVVCNPGLAGIALQSHRWHRVISGRTRVTMRVAQPPKPSRTAGVTAMPASSASRQIGRFASRTHQTGKASEAVKQSHP